MWYDLKRFKEKMKEIAGKRVVTGELHSLLLPGMVTSYDPACRDKNEKTIEYN